MSFVSLEFFFFFPLVVIFFFNLPSTVRGTLLLIASIFFYALGEFRHIPIILYSMLLCYFGAQALERSSAGMRKPILNILIVFAVSPLFYYKYQNFVADNLNYFLASWRIPEIPTHKLALPVGISFYTFQLLSYLFDVYNKKIAVESDFKFYSLFVLFFPQLVAGPIVRANELLPQLKELPGFSYRRVSDGMRTIGWGFFKKIVIADELNLYSQKIIDHPLDYQYPALWMAMFFYSIRIYCDFSGYSDIGIGAAKVFGVHFPQNFDRPYFSRSVAEFWTRWHISLYNWFKEYVYLPLGGGYVSPLYRVRNVIIVFLLSALWHGANWTFIVWGLLNAVYILLGNLLKNIRTELTEFFSLGKYLWVLQIVSVSTTFFLISVSWVFFSAKNITNARLFIMGLFRFEPISELFSRNGMAISYKSFIYAIFLILVLVAIDHNLYREKIRLWVARRRFVLRWGMYLLFSAWIIVSYMRYRAIPQDFIYFQF